MKFKIMRKNKKVNPMKFIPLFAKTLMENRLQFR